MVLDALKEENEKGNEEEEEDRQTKTAKTCRTLLIACQNGSMEILKLLVDSLELDDWTDWSAITEYLFIHKSALMNSISSQGMNRFSPYHEMSNYLRKLAQKHGKFHFLLCYDLYLQSYTRLENSQGIFSRKAKNQKKKSRKLISLQGFYFSQKIPSFPKLHFF